MHWNFQCMFLGFLLKFLIYSSLFWCRIWVVWNDCFAVPRPKTSGVFTFMFSIWDFEAFFSIERNWKWFLNLYGLSAINVIFFSLIFIALSYPQALLGTKLKFHCFCWNLDEKIDFAHMEHNWRMGNFTSNLVMRLRCEI